MCLVSLGRGVLTTAALLLLACTDLALPRIPARASGDSTPEPASTAGVSRERKAPVTADAEAAAFADIRRTLRRLVVGEATFFAENGTYTDELSVIRVSPAKNVDIRFLWVSRDGWAASGTHTALPGKDCVIFVGKAQSPPTTLKYVRAGRLGVPVCDDRSRREKSVAASPPQSPAPAPPDTANTLDLLDPKVVMKVDLRNLAHAQETYFAMQGVYARRTEPLALQYLWHRDVKVKILSADAQSWVAKATHARFPGKSCVIWFGLVPQRPSTDAQQRGEKQAGVPVCDE
jgi:hypothetical protein